MFQVSSGADWLCYTDILNKQIFSQQAYMLMSYLPYLSVIFHLNFSQGSQPKIQYPKVQYEVSVSSAKQVHVWFEANIRLVLGMFGICSVHCDMTI